LYERLSVGVQPRRKYPLRQRRRETRVAERTGYCKENPSEDFVPMVVTGHGTIHSWECVRGNARIKQSEKVDPRSFIVEQRQRL
jgi:hypothetical protein